MPSWFSRNRRTSTCLLRCEVLEPRQMLTGQLELLKDINTTKVGVTPQLGYALDDLVYFVADAGDIGVELWVSDGTPEGTSILKDIEPGPAGSSLIHFTELNGEAFFVSRSSSGDRLWRTDGTPEGTVQFEHPTISEQPVRGFRYFQKVEQPDRDVVFFPFDGELWVTDGTVSGTVFVSDESPASPSYAAPLNGELVYAQRSEGGGGELWKSDGTTAGTQEFVEIDSDDPLYPTLVSNGAGAVYFAIGHSEYGRELWKTDGTQDGTRLLKDIWEGPGGSSPTDMTVLGDTLYFSAHDGYHGRELWKSDGTTAGTVMVKDIALEQVNPNGHSLPSNFVGLGQDVYFVASDGISRSLWKTDGTELGTTIVRQGVERQDLKVVGDHLYFFSPDRKGLLRSNGTAIGTEVVQSSNEGFWDMIHANDKLFLSIQANGLWVSDETATERNPILQFPNSSTFGSWPTIYGAAGNSLFFSAGADFEPFGDPGDLWVSDGTEEGTTPLGDFRLESMPITLEDHALFFAAANNSEFELWRSDGTEDGTELIADAIYAPGEIVTSENAAYFLAENVGRQNLLWKTDGVQTQTLPKSIPAQYELTNFVAWQNDLYVVTELGEATQLWKRDETLTSAVLLFEGPEILDDGLLTELDGHLYFAADDGVSGLELWRTDGFTTEIVADLSTGGAGSAVGELTAVGDSLFFIASTEQSGTELWKTNGTAVGTELVSDIYAGARGSFPAKLTGFNDSLYFTATTRRRGRELWKSDGTSGGTKAVAGIPSGDVESILPINDRLFVSQNVLDFANSSTQIWATDENAEGLVFVADFDESSGFASLHDFGGRLVVVGWTEQYGREIWIESESLFGDVNGDGGLNAQDIDAVFAAIQDATTDLRFDLDGDGQVTSGDVDHLIANILSTCSGDANLDGVVDALDLNAVGNHWLDSGSSWESGDFTGDGETNSLDLNQLGRNWLGCERQAGASVAPHGQPLQLLVEADADNDVVVGATNEQTPQRTIDFTHPSESARLPQRRLRTQLRRSRVLHDQPNDSESNELANLVDELVGRLAASLGQR